MRYLIAFTLSTLFFLSVPFSASAVSRQARIYSVGNSNDDFGEALDDALDDYTGSHEFTYSRWYTGSAVDFRDWADANFDDDGNDNGFYGADYGDVAFYAGTGNYYCSSQDGWTHRLMSTEGGVVDTCWDCRSGPDNDVWWGDGDLNMILSIGCHSAQKCVILGDGLFNVSGNLSMYNGFHGEMSPNSGQLSSFNTYISNSEDDNAGDNWVDYMTCYDCNDEDTWIADQCAISVIYSFEEDTDDIYQNQGLAYWKSPSSHEYLTWYYQSGCKPAGGNTL